ncbi:MAG: quinone-interacting membrane-bound oxidoreductase complex subunit QmoC [Acidobacteriota bacterium]|nr:MAG: quinone-interacting membrane-bound oxidoreductase complex subunit QmoC [Acidobacteriota bacterium]
MSNAVLIQPDIAFTNQIIELGGEDVFKCMQCATCSAVCELSPAENPFPRKEVIWSQWGLKNRLLGDPDIWLCHNCGDCSARCPRGASPGTILSAIRRQAVWHYATPQFLGAWMNRAGFLPVLILIPAVLLLLALLVRDPLAALLGISSDHGPGMQYANLFPHWLLIGFFTSFLILSLVSVALGGLRFWRAVKRSDLLQTEQAPSKSLLSSFLTVVMDFLTHKRFGGCTVTATRKRAHLGIFYGFLALFLVSTWAVVLLYVLNPFMETPLPYPFSFWDPAKIIANLGALALVAGCLIAMVERIANTKTMGRSTEFDWLFLGILFLVGVTGLVTEGLRFAESVTAGYTVYFIHLILAFMLLIYLPFSKFSHAIYRTLAMTYAEQMGRRR